jgi:hypothetical protein
MRFCVRRRRISPSYTERLAEAGIEPSVGSVGDSYDNALAESIIGLYKTELIYRHGPWKGLEDVELATLTYIDWFKQPPDPRTDRRHPTRRIRSQPLPSEQSSHHGRTQANESPLNPDRFSQGLGGSGGPTNSWA